MGGKGCCWCIEDKLEEEAGTVACSDSLSKSEKRLRELEGGPYVFLNTTLAFVEAAEEFFFLGCTNLE
jgi:hypothetical protein